MLSLFSWKISVVFSFCVLALFISNIVVSLIVVSDIKGKKELKASEVTFVQASNIIFAALLGLALIGIFSLKPYWQRMFWLSNQVENLDLTFGKR